MAAVRRCLKCLQNVSTMHQMQVRYFGSSAVLERLKMDYRIKPEPKKRKNPPLQLREDFIFLYDGKAKRAFPYHDLELAMKILRLGAIREENVGLFIRLNLKGKDVDSKSIKGDIIMPKQCMERKLLVLAEGEQAEDARQAGADYVGGDEIFPDVLAEEFEFDYCLSSIEILPKIQHLSNVLGTQMPSQNLGTATSNIAFAVKEFKRGQKYKSTKDGGISLPIGRLSFTDDEIKENLQAAINMIKTHSPGDVPPETFIQRVYIKSCHGPALMLHKRDFLNIKRKKL